MRARMLCGGDQTCCCMAISVWERVLLYRESIIAGSRINTEVEAMYTVTLERSWSREWSMNCHARWRWLRHELQVCKAPWGSSARAKSWNQHIDVYTKNNVKGVVYHFVLWSLSVPLLIATQPPTAPAYVMGSIRVLHKALKYDK